jgi:uncharacterized membrane protein YesL
MEKFFESKPVLYLSKFVDIVVLNILFVICCIPVFTAGAAWTAMYYACVKAVRMDCGKIITDFFHSFRMNFKTATAVWLLYLVLFSGLVAVTYLLLVTGSGGVYAMLVGLFMALLLFLIAMMLYSFPILSRFTVRSISLLKNAVLVSVKHGGETICMLVLTLALATLVVMGWKFFPLLLLIMPGVYTLMLSMIMEKVLAQYIDKSVVGEEPKEPEDGVSEQEMLYGEKEKRTPWYLEGGAQDEQKTV